jgi:hypothetical protein
MLKRLALLSSMICTAMAASSAPAVAQHGWSDYSAAAAIAYCMAVHPNRSPAGAYTNGFEHVAPPGVVGAVRRNFIYDRLKRYPKAVPGQDDGTRHTCADACKEWGRASSGVGRPLHTGTSPKDAIPSGIGDIAATALWDWEFPKTKSPVVAGFTGRPQNYHMNDGGQADFCCCHLWQ